MLIRLATRADSAALARLVGEYWRFEAIAGFAPARVSGLLEAFLSQPERGACWVADERGDLHGYLLAVYVFSLEHGGLMAEIDEFYVRTELRGGGLGARLLSAAETALGAAGVVRLQLQVGVGNQRGGRFYQRQGFSPRDGYTLLEKPLQRA
jgi:GNAT superfamily N-acetyltransferase